MKVGWKIQIKDNCYDASTTRELKKFYRQSRFGLEDFVFDPEQNQWKRARDLPELQFLTIWRKFKSHASTATKVLALGFLVLVLISALGRGNTETQLSSPSQTTVRVETKELVGDRESAVIAAFEGRSYTKNQLILVVLSAQEAGLIRKMKEEEREVQIGRREWDEIDIDEKRSFIKLIGEYVFSQRGRWRTVEFIDSESGAKLAQYRPVSGVRIISR